MRRAPGAPVLAVVVVAAVLRLAGLFGDLWLDEIWSIRMVEAVGSPLEILTALRHDNNHPLHSLWLYLVGGDAPPWLFRLPAWLAGAAAVAVAAQVGRVQYTRLHPGDERGAGRTATAAAVLLGFSYPFVHYASEARGYAPAVLFALVAFLAALRFTERSGPGEGRPAWAGLYAVASILAFLAHPTAAVVLVGGLVLQAGAAGRGGRAGPGALLLAHGVPALALAAFVAGFVRSMTIGGGPDRNLLAVLGELSAYTLGLPPATGVAALAALGLVTAASLVVLARRSPSLAAAYGTMIVVAPAAAMVVGPTTVPFPRYFLVPAAFALLGVAYGVARLQDRGRGARAVVALVAAGFVVGNLLHALALMQDGRGAYRKALAHIAATSPFAEITLTGDHDFRTGTVAAWHAPAAGEGRTVLYLPAGDLPPRGAQWYLLHRFRHDPPAPPDVVDPDGHRYVRDRTFPHAGLSGWDWVLYRNEELPR